MSITAVVSDIVMEVIDRIKGSSDELTARNIATIVADKVLESVAVMIRVELENHAAALGLVLSIRELTEACEGVLSSIREAERHGGLVARTLEGVHIEIMPPDWKPE